MKRAIFGKVVIALSLCVTVAACTPSAPAESEKVQTAIAVEGWTRPPVIQSFRRSPGGLIFTGQAEPGARIVLRQDSGPAYAAATDSGGSFEIRMSSPSGDLLLRPETQTGQDAAPAPERLLIVDGGRGPVAILRAGGATRRLDRAPALGAVDSDGRMRIISGYRPPGSAAIDLQAADETGQVTPDGEGRWSLVAAPSAGPDDIRVGVRTFAWPGEAAGDAPFRVERAGAGWRVVWSERAGGRQTTWLPDAE